jgi:hypothetical protein
LPDVLFESRHRRVGNPAFDLALCVQFANQRANRMKALVRDGFGLWLVARRLHQGKFV